MCTDYSTVMPSDLQESIRDRGAVRLRARAKGRGEPRAALRCLWLPDPVTPAVKAGDRDLVTGLLTRARGVSSRARPERRQQDLRHVLRREALGEEEAAVERQAVARRRGQAG